MNKFIHIAMGLLAAAALITGFIAFGRFSGLIDMYGIDGSVGLNGPSVAANALKYVFLFAAYAIVAYLLGRMRDQSDKS